MIRRAAATLACLAVLATPAFAQAANDSTDCAAVHATLHTMLQAHIADGMLDSASLAVIHTALMSAYESGTMPQMTAGAADSVHVVLHALMMGAHGNMPVDSTTHAAMLKLMHSAATCTAKQ